MFRELSIVDALPKLIVLRRSRLRWEQHVQSMVGVIQCTLPFYQFTIRSSQSVCMERPCCYTLCNTELTMDTFCKRLKTLVY